MTARAITAAVSAAVLHVDRSHPEGVPLRRAFLDGQWPLRQRRPSTIAAYLDPIKVLLPVAYRAASGTRRLDSIDVRWVAGWTLTPDGRAVFTTVPAPQLAHLVGAPSPVQWAAGDAWPVKILHLPVLASALTALSALSAQPGLRAA